MPLRFAIVPVRGDAVVALIGDRDGEINQFLGERIELARRERRLHLGGERLHHRGMPRHCLPDIVDVGRIDAAPGRDALDHRLGARTHVLVLGQSRHGRSYSMISSAWASRLCGTARPKRVAPGRFTTSANWVGNSIGRSAGLAPLTMPVDEVGRTLDPRPVVEAVGEEGTAVGEGREVAGRGQPARVAVSTILIVLADENRLDVESLHAGLLEIGHQRIVDLLGRVNHAIDQLQAGLGDDALRLAAKVLLFWSRVQPTKATHLEIGHQVAQDLQALARQIGPAIDMPVRLPPGRAMLCARPVASGSETGAMTRDRLACVSSLTIMATGVAVTTIASTLRATRRLAVSRVSAGSPPTKVASSSRDCGST
jgi:hypothetical protein